MFQQPRTCLKIFLLLLAALPLFGCATGISGGKPQGKIVKDGKPLSPIKGETLQLVLQGKLATGMPVAFAATLNQATFNFTVDGPEDQGIPPGSYTLTLSYVIDGTRPAESERPQEVIDFNKDFGQAGTPLKLELSSSARLIVIDVGKKTVELQ